MIDGTGGEPFEADIAVSNKSRPYDSAHPEMKLLRLAVFERLRREPTWDELPSNAADFDQYVEHVNPERKYVLVFHLHEVLWQLLTEGVLAPGFDSSNLKLPFFHAFT